jgi:hypothetical protein
VEIVSPLPEAVDLVLEARGQDWLVFVRPDRRWEHRLEPGQRWVCTVEVADPGPERGVAFTLLLTEAGLPASERRFDIKLP